MQYSVSYVYFQNRIADDRPSNFSSFISTISSTIGVGFVLGLAPLMKRDAATTLLVIAGVAVALSIVLTLLGTPALKNAPVNN